MLDKLSGLIEGDVNPLSINLGPISLAINIPRPSELKAGEETTVHTHLVVREDALILYGFLDLRERVYFREFLKVSGLGPKTALVILESLTLEEMYESLRNSNMGPWKKIPGLGPKKTVKLFESLRQIAEKYPVSGTKGVSVVVEPSLEDALSSLGYTAYDIGTVARKIEPTLSLQAKVKQALKILGKKQ